MESAAAALQSSATSAASSLRRRVDSLKGDVLASKEGSFVCTAGAPASTPPRADAKEAEGFMPLQPERNSDLLMSSLVRRWPACSPASAVAAGPAPPQPASQTWQVDQTIRSDPAGTEQRSSTMEDASPARG